MENSSERKRVLIAGGGVAGLEAMFALRTFAGDRVDLEILTRATVFHYRPLDVVQPFGRGGLRHLPLAELTELAGARHRTGSLVAVDAPQKLARTDRGEAIPYDVLVVCTGARTLPGLEGALTFRGPASLTALGEVLARARSGDRLAFVLPPGASWGLPLYELALLSAEDLARRGRQHTEIVLVTHEPRPLAAFGSEVTEAVTLLLERDGVALRTGVFVDHYHDGLLRLASGEAIAADSVIAMPRLRGPRLHGLPHDDEGFLPTDSFGRVLGVTDVYAAGDVTHHPIKQGGLASQQADSAASAIAARLGVKILPMSYEPILRAQLLTTGASRFFEVDIHHPDRKPTIQARPAEPFEGKVASRFLAPILSQRGMGQPSATPPPFQE